MTTFAMRLITRLSFPLRYTATSLPLFIVWEVVQLPLYTIWHEQGVQASLWAAAHCTLGDAAIAFSVSLASLTLAALMPALQRTWPLSILIVLSGLLVTAGFEWASTEWLDRWAYSDRMPIVPLLGLGLSPLLQWVVVPAITLAFLRRRLASALRPLPVTAEGIGRTEARPSN